MPKPPKTPPDSPEHEPVEKSEELKREEEHPSKTLRDRTEQEKGLPPDAKTSWN